jgi:hypothetical protein
MEKAFKVPVDFHVFVSCLSSVTIAAKLFRNFVRENQGKSPNNFHIKHRQQ